MPRYVLLNIATLTILYCHNLFASAPAVHDSPSTIHASAAPTNTQEQRPVKAKINTLVVNVAPHQLQHYLSLPSPERRQMPMPACALPPARTSPILQPLAVSPSHASGPLSPRHEPDAKHKQTMNPDTKTRLDGAIDRGIDSMYRTSIDNPGYIRALVSKKQPTLDVNSKTDNEALIEHSMNLYVKPALEKIITRHWAALYPDVAMSPKARQDKIDTLITTYIAQTQSRPHTRNQYVMSLRDMMHDVWVPTFSDEVRACFCAWWCCLSAQNRANTVTTIASPTSAATAGSVNSARSRSATQPSAT